MSLRVIGALCGFVLLGCPSQVSAIDRLEDCLGPGSVSCSVSPSIPVGDDCDGGFYRYVGRVAWGPLEYNGPVKVSVKTKSIVSTILPLYIEVRSPEWGPGDIPICTSTFFGHLLMTSLGDATCGGSWQSIGPIDLARYGIRSGDLYIVQASFFETIPDPFGGVAHSPGLSCIRVEPAETPIASTSWTRTKMLYK